MKVETLLRLRLGCLSVKFNDNGYNWSKNIKGNEVEITNLRINKLCFQEWNMLSIEVLYIILRVKMRLRNGARIEDR